MLSLILLASPVISAEEQDEVFLDIGENKQEVSVNKHTKKIEKLEYSIDSEEYINHRNIHEYNNRNLYDKKTVTNTKEKKFGDVTVGNTSSTTFSADSYSNTNNTYAKYQKGKMGIGTSYKSSGLQQMDKGTLSVTPEYQLNKKMSVQNTYSSNLTDKSKKGEIGLKFKPMKDDRMDLNVGAAQVYREDSSPTSSQLNFSTQLRF